MRKTKGQIHNRLENIRVRTVKEIVEEYRKEKEEKDGHK